MGDLELLGCDKISIPVSCLCEKHFSVFTLQKQKKKKKRNRASSKLYPIPAINNIYPQTDGHPPKKHQKITSSSISLKDSFRIKHTFQCITITDHNVVYLCCFDQLYSNNNCNDNLEKILTLRAFFF